MKKVRFAVERGENEWDVVDRTQTHTHCREGCTGVSVFTATRREDARAEAKRRNAEVAS